LSFELSIGKRAGWIAGIGWQNHRIYGLVDEWIPVRPHPPSLRYGATGPGPLLPGAYAYGGERWARWLVILNDLVLIVTQQGWGSRQRRAQPGKDSKMYMTLEKAQHQLHR